MTNLIPVSMGSCAAAHNPAVISTSGVGSCLAIIFYDPLRHIGGLAHAMLPRVPRDADGKTTTLRYVDAAINFLLTELKKLGADPARLEAKLIGGAHMFPLLGNAETSVGTRNVEEARKILASKNIPLTGEDTGGTAGRNVLFDLANGICTIETKV